MDVNAAAQKWIQDQYDNTAVSDRSYSLGYGFANVAGRSDLVGKYGKLAVQTVSEDPTNPQVTSSVFVRDSMGKGYTLTEIVSALRSDGLSDSEIAMWIDGVIAESEK